MKHLWNIEKESSVRIHLNPPFFLKRGNFLFYFLEEKGVLPLLLGEVRRGKYLKKNIIQAY